MIEEIRQQINALRDYDEYAPPIEPWGSTGALMKDSADTMERLLAVYEAVGANFDNPSAKTFGDVGLAYYAVQTRQEVFAGAG